MPEMHLRQPRCTYSACGPFTKNKERIKKIKETGDSRYIYQNKLGKACFQHDMAYGDFKDLNRITFADKLLRDEGCDTAKDPIYDGYQRGVASVVYNFFDKKTSCSSIKNENISNKESAKDLHKRIIRNFNKRKVHLSFTDNIWGAHLADMQLINELNKGFRFLLCVIEIYSKYAWIIIPLKDKKSITITHTFQKILKASNRKLNKIWVDKGNGFYNRSMKS